MPYDLEIEEFHEEQTAKLNYFDKFKDMKPYFEITEDEWTYIKKTFDKDTIKEKLADILMGIRTFDSGLKNGLSIAVKADMSKGGPSSICFCILLTPSAEV